MPPRSVISASRSRAIGSGRAPDPPSAASPPGSDRSAPPGRTAPEPAQRRPDRRQYHVHGTLLTYCAVALLIAVGAFNSNNNLLYWLFGLALGMVIVSGMISGAMLMGLCVEREPVEPAAQGAPVTIRYRVTNRNRFVPAFALTISEEPAADAGAPAPSGPAAPAPRHATLFGPAAGFLAHVAPGQTVVVEAVAGALARGRLALDHYRVTSAFPFGIVRKSLRFSRPALAYVRPAPADVPVTTLRPPLTARGSGEAASASVGPGDHFHALREYRPGDSPRLIAWRASARLSGPAGAGLLVRQTTAPVPKRAWLIVDLAHAPDESHYEQALCVAAAVVIHAEREGLPLGLLIPSIGLDRPPRPGRWHAGGLLNDLACVPAFAPARASAGPPPTEASLPAATPTPAASAAVNGPAHASAHTPASTANALHITVHAHPALGGASRGVPTSGGAVVGPHPGPGVHLFAVPPRPARAGGATATSASEAGSGA